MSVSHRPLSPHLGIYRWQLTMALSILHRASGVFLSLGTVLLVLVLLAIATGQSEFEMIQGLLNNIIGQLFMLGWTVSLYLHMANGLRHLIWDAGVGLGKNIANQSGVFVIAFTVIATGATWALAIWSGS
ncbi:MAG: succinate dehydrogenase, cytochrome b556 subunit [Gammaproteobacteria bacterium TMED119]|nr:MAG: succinate dehydrogenase, cytochrome b556 subunit [Gammaproteobacteria bacterium TMED119]RCL46754.1 MAG: succinate dehydrogenase, cytochrome b556 subunit [Candidatus Thioglobus sp.]